MDCDSGESLTAWSFGKHLAFDKERRSLPISHRLADKSAEGARHSGSGMFNLSGKRTEKSTIVYFLMVRPELMALVFYITGNFFGVSYDIKMLLHS